MKYSEQMRKIRLNLGIRKDEVASMVHVSLRTVDIWESARNDTDMPIAKFELFINKLQNGCNDYKLEDDGYVAVFDSQTQLQIDAIVRSNFLSLICDPDNDIACISSLYIDPLTNSIKPYRTKFKISFNKHVIRQVEIWKKMNEKEIVEFLKN